MDPDRADAKAWVRLSAGLREAERCTWVYMGVHGCTGVYRGVQGCTWVYMGVHGCTWVYMGVQGCTGVEGGAEVCRTPLNHLVGLFVPRVLRMGPGPF